MNSINKALVESQENTLRKLYEEVEREREKEKSSFVIDYYIILHQCIFFDFSFG